jgi:hypothetical protein
MSNQTHTDEHTPANYYSYSYSYSYNHTATAITTTNTTTAAGGTSMTPFSLSGTLVTKFRNERRCAAVASSNSSS